MKATTAIRKNPAKKVKLTIEVPKDLEVYFSVMNEIDELKRDALILYPHILAGEMSHGRAAEILGINKWDLIDLYGEMGFSYYDMTINELDEDIETYYHVMGKERA